MRSLARAGHRWIVYPALAVFLPADCFACGRPLRERQRLGACPDCWAALVPLRPPLCAICGLPLPAGTDLLGPARGRCAACLLEPPGLDGVRAAVAYDGFARKLLLRAKFAGRREILAVLGELLGRVVLASGFARGCDLVVPVPSHPWVRLRRGWNPALEIARPLAAALDVPLVPRTLRRRLLQQGVAKRLDARMRRRSTLDAFFARRRADRKRVLLVDDVMTSGATAEACARALRAAGAAEVRLAVWARTLPHRAFAGTPARRL